MGPIPGRESEGEGEGEGEGLFEFEFEFEGGTRERVGTAACGPGDSIGKARVSIAHRL